MVHGLFVEASILDLFVDGAQSPTPFERTDRSAFERLRVGGGWALHAEAASQPEWRPRNLFSFSLTPSSPIGQDGVSTWG